MTTQAQSQARPPVVVAILSMMTRQDVSATTIRQSTNRAGYEAAYIEAQRLYREEHMVDKRGNIVKHASKWTRRIR